MPRELYDVIVIGGGLLGGATAYALAENNISTLLIDARKKGHAHGSSHGRSRIIRTVASESAVFRDMAAESFIRMQALSSSYRTVARRVKALFVTSEASAAFSQLAKAGGSGPELTAAEVFKTWGIRLSASGAGIIDATSGILDPAALMEVFDEKIGAENILRETEVASWHASLHGVTIKTRRGDVFQSRQLVLAVGAWLPSLLHRGNTDTEVAAKLSRCRIERIPLFYFDYPSTLEPLILVTLSRDGHPDMYAMPEFPTRSKTPADGEQRPGYLKVGFHAGTVIDGPDNVCRSVLHLEERFALEYMRVLLGLDLRLLKTDVCLYAMPPDTREPEDSGLYNQLPLLGPLPRTPSVFLAAFGGGICAKHALVIGDQICSLLQRNQPRFEMSEFDPARRLRLG